jgi:hypothetical protein
MAALTQALQLAGDEQLPVTAMRRLVMDHGRPHHIALGLATLAVWLSDQLRCPKSLPFWRSIEAAPGFGLPSVAIEVALLFVAGLQTCRSEDRGSVSHGPRQQKAATVSECIPSLMADR